MPPSFAVVENGIDHRSSEQPLIIPEALIDHFSARPYLLMLGATYAHKNRDLGIRIWKKLRQRGLPHSLILVGASVPFGSSRLQEAELSEGIDEPLILPDVPSEERNWLLRHTSLVLYPTSAEGFGLIPFEAACFGRPCLYVSFGPLREVINEETAPRTFDLESLVDRAETLLNDPRAAKESVDWALSKRSNLSWEETARKAVGAYYQILGKYRN